ncbi:MAG: hypothetical protein A2750_03505 [Candidatus Yanofskybacteria bacterium RIFCSPHIGHO2_01_FULL_45_42]|uniref:Thioredoxin domain-containing protein n=3 Tax=Candidatus Yanofskyibacteriota TaxID=1752733 RepID=A0A1F8F067_9BACT|nr:MAG: hypothetical protein A2750_03505 [Candidatus Yanofskybacteria bacterium RIFCSPHIGHO2_01_FULL_45_42]OGN16137.1 MAG: hypothetical protein A3C81_00995 [Candidatus Yanofskybacteria bacterium RIFCSPHIGHO2_02_FULL_46_19]OGN26243.1 MAG: hypothetical protein A3B17_02665 [Candidatus Yanofskybacteria bacterium RIFCSPLOWO2_01_FULL_45_72]OGN31791.1 MAG: hypothetical protein A3J01_03310 [Candidatus Yanofskybacteria bacterium RIFCSPLOWO2_02_FULL_45_18]
MKNLIIWLIIFGAVGGLIALLISNQSGNSGVAGDLAVPVGLADRIRGKADSKVILVEYSDFQCPACRFWHPILEGLYQDYGDRVGFVLRHFPLSQHKNAQLMAQGSEAAGQQGKFWEMSSLLFEKQKDWESASNVRDILTGYAVSLGLNKEKFLADMDSSEIKDKVNNDSRSGSLSKIPGTPTFFLNGKELTNLRGYEDIKAALDAALSNIK